MNELRVVLLGASGFVGGAVLRRLAALPGERRAYVLTHRSSLATAFQFVTDYSGSMEALPPALFPPAPHVVIHCASKQIDRDGTGFEVNLRGMERLAAAVNSHTRAILYTSSYSVYGEGPQRDITEDAQPQPQSDLARSRARCEARLVALAHASACKAIILRPRFVIGDGDRYFLPGLAKLARSPLGIASGEQRFSLIDVDDYARVILAMAQQVVSGAAHFAPVEVFNVGYQRPIALREIREILGEVIAVQPPRYRIPVRDVYLKMLDRVPSMRLRQLAQRLRLLGYDHYGTTRKLQARLNDDILLADPRQAVRNAARSLAVC